MCNFFSFVEDKNGQYYAFLPKDRKGIKIRGEKANYDSHTAICEYYKLNDDKVNKWEWNPFDESIKLDTQSLLDARNDLAMKWARKNIDTNDQCVKLSAVKQDGNFIKYFSEPSEDVQLTAVRIDGCAIQNISEPSEKVQLAAVRQNGHAIKYISKPSERVQLAAVKRA